MLWKDGITTVDKESMWHKFIIASQFSLMNTGLRYVGKEARDKYYHLN